MDPGSPINLEEHDVGFGLNECSLSLLTTWTFKKVSVGTKVSLVFTAACYGVTLDGVVFLV